jgi:hypothetical protein
MSMTTSFDLPYPPTSPLILSDRLLTLAEDADRAGLQDTADHLILLAHRVFDESPRHDA